jgi:uncharacterized membrane protein YciS (DUF1049 family)
MKEIIWFWLFILFVFGLGLFIGWFIAACRYRRREIERLDYYNHQLREERRIL